MRGSVSHSLLLALIFGLLAPGRTAAADPTVVFSDTVTTNGLLTAIYHPDGTIDNVFGADIWRDSTLILTQDAGTSGGSFQPAITTPLIWSAADPQTTFIWSTPPLVGTPDRPLVFFTATLLHGASQPLLWVYSVELDADGTTTVTRGLLFLK